jgi:hypothetical protein
MDRGQLLSATGHLCHAVEELRGTGLLELAADVESLIAILELELLLHADRFHD